MLLTDLQKQIAENIGLNLKNEKEIEKYFKPDWERDLYPAEKIKDMDKSVERIKKAIDKNENIVVFADYDCDGIPGAVVLHDFFKKINYEKFLIYIPHRHNEGYGLNKKAIEKFIEEKYSLMITVDIGITNLEEIKLAQDGGIDVILTDHHLPILDEQGKQILPKAFTIINTKQNDDKYQEKFLCGCSTAWKLVNAFLNKHRDKYNVKEGWEKWLLDMVAISTIADLVPLKNENRLFVKYGLQVLRKSARPGLQKILTNAKIDQKSICEDDIAYGVAPRINSASRMAEPLEAFYALLHNEESIDYANKLEKFNTNRKFDTKEAIESIDTEKLRGEEIIFLGDENWGPGILGLIATKVGETTGKTCFIWGMGEDKNIMKGSVRVGENNLNVVEIMTRGEMFLENFGGHEAAGGFAIHKDKIKDFENFLKGYSKNINKNLKENKKVEQDNFILLEIDEINRKIYEEIKIFSPFGVGNPKPTFKIKLNGNHNVNSKRFGKNKEHLEISVNNLRGIEFFVNENREKDLLEKKEYLINIEWDNYRRDVVIKFLK